jgi:hypothetical protein
MHELPSVTRDGFTWGGGGGGGGGVGGGGGGARGAHPNDKRTVNNNYNTIVKQDFAVVKQVDGRVAHMTDTTRHQSWQSTPTPTRSCWIHP